MVTLLQRRYTMRMAIVVAVVVVVAVAPSSFSAKPAPARKALTNQRWLGSLSRRDLW